MVTKELNHLLESIAVTTNDYRKKDLGEITPEHVYKWIDQFDSDIQLPVLKEMDSVLKETYLSEAKVLKVIEQTLKDKDLVGKDAQRFWQKANFLDIQLHGNSQKEMLRIFDKVLQEQFGLQITDSDHNSNIFVYLDDIIFNGDRVKQDMMSWVTNKAPSRASVYIVSMGQHSGSYWNRGQLQETIQKSGKNITLFWYPKLYDFENRKAKRNESNVLWPTDSIYQHKEISNYISKNPNLSFEPREESSEKNWPFSSEKGRQLLEKEFTLAGLKILSECQDPSEKMKPLGYGMFGLGFGSIIVTFRNCPNNNPLALWWGDPSKPDFNPLSQWYPLFPRKVYD